MSNPMSQAIPQGNMQVLQQQKMRNGSPKMGPNANRPMKSNIKTKEDTRTGDVVSDESDDGDNEGAASADDGESDSDEPNGFALSGTRYAGSKAAARLAGLKAQDVEMMDDAEAGAERENTDEDSDDYAAVENVSDNDSLEDEDEHEVLQSAEKDLIAEFERTEKPRQAKAMTDGLGDMSLKEDAALARRLSLQSEESQQDDLDLDLDFDTDPFGGLPTADSLYQELIEESEEAFDHDMLSSWRRSDAATSRENSLPSNGQKKVRFEETPSSRASSMSSDEDARQSFPDLFDANDGSMTMQQMILNGMDIDAVDNESEYEFEDEQKVLKLEASDTDMSDTDSDEGDTTDEESPEEQLARVKAYRAAREAKEKAEGKKSSTPKSAPSTPVASKRATPALARAKTTAGRVGTPNGASRPRTGTFNISASHASVTADVRGSGIKVVCPKKPPAKDRAYWERARQAIGSRDGSPGGSVAWTPSTHQAPSIPKRPFTAKSTLGTMFDGNLDFLRNHDENGIAKEFLKSARKGSLQSSFTSNTMTSEASDSEANVNIEDFVRMDDSDSDEDEPASATIFSPAEDHFNDNFFETSPVTSRGNGTGLLDHFDQQRGLVSSFRNNQNHARLVSSLPANPASRAQTSEANALQKGRRGAANAPITPARKKRQSQDLDSTGAGVKKLASPLVQKHRRSRGNSLSGGIHQTLALDRFAGGMQ